MPADFSLERAKHRRHRKRKGTQAPYPARIPDPRLPLVVLHYDRLNLPTAVKPADKRQRLILLRSRAIVHVLYSTAGRLSEVARLDRSAVGEGLAEQAIIIGKGNKKRTLFFTKEARAAIRALVAHTRRIET